MKKILLVLLSVFILFSAGCRARTISTKPLDFGYTQGAAQIDGACGICISESDLSKEVVEGTISDSYKYTPYADLHFGLGYALNETCDSIGYYENKDDAMANGAQVIVVPRLQTESEPTFPFWPPDTFSISMDTDIFDNAGSLIQRTQSSATATAERADWKMSNGYAGSKAMEKVIQDFLGELDYGLINQRVKASSVQPSAAPEKAVEVEKLKQAIQLYQGVLTYPVAPWVKSTNDLKFIKSDRNQTANTFAFDQIPVSQEFESWSKLYGVYGFHLPEYDMNRFVEESMNFLALGCDAQAEFKVVSSDNDKVIVSFFCSDLKDSLVKKGNNTESGLLYISQVEQSFAKVYAAWRAPSKDMNTDKWPLTEEQIADVIQRMETIRYFKPE
tara:strand:+ start:5217 stop:6380 length:1164 start_codon:yes stop_codon:yes gene_type:complete